MEATWTTAGFPENTAAYAFGLGQPTTAAAAWWVEAAAELLERVSHWMEATWTTAGFPENTAAYALGLGQPTTTAAAWWVEAAAELLERVRFRPLLHQPLALVYIF
ncbi:hypothetical protein Nepgr_032532 [Nepenthes gracilis]|uniref:Uncharacterized protein n=1 Tax=Nepenthes gracilis TaxID=150966 RepID=A0AAD3Y7Y8_NEPGR|nr:hypothetical protein Nepgr_032532 [Nepenthes gracilis]